MTLAVLDCGVAEVVPAEPAAMLQKASLCYLKLWVIALVLGSQLVDGPVS